jgi:hypothetical protein
MVERVMILDAVLGDRRCSWLSPASDKWRFFCLKRDNYLQPDDYPHIAFGTGPQGTIRCFPDKLPIGIEKDDHDRLVFLYLVNRRLPVDFRQFLRSCSSLRESRTTEFDSIEPPQPRRSSGIWSPMKGPHQVWRPQRELWVVGRRSSATLCCGLHDASGRDSYPAI